MCVIGYVFVLAGCVYVLMGFVCCQCVCLDVLCIEGVCVGVCVCRWGMYVDSVGMC